MVSYALLASYGYPGSRYKANALCSLQCSMDTVIEGFLDLIADTSKSGAALLVNKEQGLTYVYT